MKLVVVLNFIPFCTKHTALVDLFGIERTFSELIFQSDDRAQQRWSPIGWCARATASGLFLTVSYYSFSICPSPRSPLSVVALSVLWMDFNWFKPVRFRWLRGWRASVLAKGLSPLRKGLRFVPIVDFYTSILLVNFRRELPTIVDRVFLPIPVDLHNHKILFIFSSVTWTSRTSGTGFSLSYPSIILHAVSTDLSSFPHECLYVLVDASKSGTCFSLHREVVCVLLSSTQS